MCECEKKCKCTALCSHVSGFQLHLPAGGSDLSPIYFAHHFDVGSVDDTYHLPIGLSEGQVMVLRLRTSGGGILRVNVDQLAGNLTQVQLPVGGNYAVMHWKCCQWYMADTEGGICT